MRRTLRAALFASLVVMVAGPLATAQDGASPEPQREASWPDGEYNPFGHSPIRVFLDLSNLTEETGGYASSIQAAFRYWEADLNGRLAWDARFEEAPRREDADIVLWLRDASRSGPTCDESEVALGCARPFERPVLVELVMQLGDGSYRSYEQLREVATHEVGHAIGLPHAASRDDVMAPHVSLRSGFSWRPGDLPRLALGAGFLLILMVALVYGGWRALRPTLVIEPLGPNGPTGECPQGGPHAFDPVDVRARGKVETWNVCARCNGGYRTEE